MLQITIPAAEQWDELNQVFVYTKEQSLRLEHSLVSLSKWESKWHKSFLGHKSKTYEETLDYIRCMTITQNVNPEVYNLIDAKCMKQIQDYIDDPMTATYIETIGDNGPGGDTVTSELIYYWMIASNIPFECQKWHLNRLFALIKVCNIKNTPPKKMSRQQIMNRNAAINAARRKKYNTKG